MGEEGVGFLFSNKEEEEEEEGWGLAATGEPKGLLLPIGEAGFLPAAAAAVGEEEEGEEAFIQEGCVEEEGGGGETGRVGEAAPPEGDIDGPGPRS